MTLLGHTGTSARPARRDAPGGTAVELRGLRRAYAGLTALDGLDLRLEPGELVALLGPSGCGKTTALRILAGFERPDAGEVLLDGAEIAHVPPQHRDMGMVFQSYSLFPTMTAEDNVAFGLRLRKLARRDRRRRALELLELVGLDAHAGHYPHQLSGGQQQRVALARALAIEPRVLLLDEPLSALDAKVRVQLRDHIRSLQSRLGITTLFVTHDQEEALSLADRVGVMRAGRLEQLAPPAELYAEPATGFVAGFVGTMNAIPATRAGDTVRLLDRSARARADLEDARHGPVVALVRPEGLAIEQAADGEAIVTTRTFLGYLTRFEVLLTTGVSVKVDCPSAAAGALAPGALVAVRLLEDAVLVAPAPGAAGPAS